MVEAQDAVVGILGSVGVILAAVFGFLLRWRGRNGQQAAKPLDGQPIAPPGLPDPAGTTGSFKPPWAGVDWQELARQVSDIAAQQPATQADLDRLCGKFDDFSDGAELKWAAFCGRIETKVDDVAMRLDRHLADHGRGGVPPVPRPSRPLLVDEPTGE